MRTSCCTGLIISVLFFVAPVFPAATAKSPLSISKAEKNLGKGLLDDIYLAYMDMQPGDHPEGDDALARLLVNASAASIKKDDHHLAMSLASVAMRVTPESTGPILAFAKAAQLLDLRGAAAEALENGLRLDPKNGELLFQRAILAKSERDLNRAARLFESIGEDHSRYAEARKKAQKVRAELQKEALTLKEVESIEAELLEKQEAASQQRASGGKSPDTEVITIPDRVSETGIISLEDLMAEMIRAMQGVEPQVQKEPEAKKDPGMTSRESRNFIISYNRGDRDFAQRADLEVRIINMLEDIRERVGERFGYRPEKPIEVVLYTAEEFANEFGNAFGQHVLGFYAGKIRMNRSEEIRDPSFRRIVVHEYIHALVDQLAGGKGHLIPVWLNEGLAVWSEYAITRSCNESLMNAPQRKYWFSRAQSVPLSLLYSTSFGNLSDPGSAYIKSRAAVEVLIGTGGGLRRVLNVIEKTGEGIPFNEAFEAEFGSTRLENLCNEANRLLERKAG